ncbi:hypothetical protein AVEN_25188-2 [Araneus ventricosus]|uniref:Uncharacterized protein n=1 Tax=Araneus ventricosus TaxID=182803 RepID=A0A4Y2RRP6_ARAVE|nr:hypothetical protein AVEN_25188-2 [Araneus ventricosus]
MDYPVSEANLEPDSCDPSENSKRNKNLYTVIPSLAVICGCNMKEAFVSSTTKLQASAGSFFKESSFTLGLKRFLLKTPGLYYIELNLTW